MGGLTNFFLQMHHPEGSTTWWEEGFLSLLLIFDVVPVHRRSLFLNSIRSPPPVQQASVNAYGNLLTTFHLKKKPASCIGSCNSADLVRLLIWGFAIEGFH